MPPSPEELYRRKLAEQKRQKEEKERLEAEEAAKNAIVINEQETDIFLRVGQSAIIQNCGTYLRTVEPILKIHKGGIITALKIGETNVIGFKEQYKVHVIPEVGTYLPTFKSTLIPFPEWFHSTLLLAYKPTKKDYQKHTTIKFVVSKNNHVHQIRFEGDAISDKLKMQITNCLRMSNEYWYHGFQDGNPAEIELEIDLDFVGKGKNQWTTITEKEDMKDNENEGNSNLTDTGNNLKDHENEGFPNLRDLPLDVNKSFTEYDGHIPPKFNDGDLNTFFDWVNSRLVYPKEAAENGVMGRVVVEFTVDENGNVVNVKALRGPDISLKQELERVVKSSPKWKPASENGKSVSVTGQIDTYFYLR